MHHTKIVVESLVTVLSTQKILLSTLEDLSISPKPPALTSPRSPHSLRFLRYRPDSISGSTHGKRACSVPDGFLCRIRQLPQLLPLYRCKGSWHLKRASSHNMYPFVLRCSRRSKLLRADMLFASHLASRVFAILSSSLHPFSLL